MGEALYVGGRDPAGGLHAWPEGQAHSVSQSDWHARFGPPERLENFECLSESDSVSLCIAIGGCEEDGNFYTASVCPSSRWLEPLLHHTVRVVRTQAEVSLNAEVWAHSRWPDQSNKSM